MIYQGIGLERPLAPLPHNLHQPFKATSDTHRLYIKSMQLSIQINASPNSQLCEISGTTAIREE